MPSQRARLTQQIAERAVPRTARYTILDTEISGFRLVIHPSGRKSFALRYAVGGGRGALIREPKIGNWPSMKTDIARRIAADWSASVRLGGDPGGQRKEQRVAPIMSDLFDRYMKDHAVPNKKASSVAGDETLLRLFLNPLLGSKKVAGITRADIDALHKGMANHRYRANRCLAVLSKAFNLAEVWGWRADHTNPVRHVSKFPETKRRRYLSSAEFADLGAALRRAELGELRKPISVYAVSAIRLLAFTGARRGEILGLEWGWIDWEHGRVHLPDSKTGQKTLPLNGPTLEILRSLPRQEGNPFVIVGGKPGTRLVNLKDPWQLIVRAASLKDFRLHDLRHSFASVGVSGGLGLPVIGAMLGHTQTQTTARYAHLADDPIRDASEQTANSVAAAMRGETRGREGRVSWMTGSGEAVSGASQM